MGCILYELATGTRAFRSDYAVLEYRYSQSNMKVFLDGTLGDHAIQTLTAYIVSMLQINSSARPSASNLTTEFTQECRGIEPNDTDSFVASLALSDRLEELPSTLPNHQIVEFEDDSPIPILPQHVIGMSLYEAVLKGYIEVAVQLIDANADVNAQEGYFGSALQAASYHGHETVVQMRSARDQVTNL